MDLLYRTQLDGFCIVSSDSDFTRLASRLRESDKYVLGMGESKTPRSFISACNRFLYLDVLYAESKREDMPETEQAALQEEPAEPRNHAKISKAVQEGNKKVRAIRSALIKLTDENSTIMVGSVQVIWVISSFANIPTLTCVFMDTRNSLTSSVPLISLKSIQQATRRT